MAETLTQKLTRTAEGMRLYQQERAILEVTELICLLMQERGMSRSKLAARLGKSKGYVSQLLNGTRNMTVRTISDVFSLLGHALHFQEGPLKATAWGPSLIPIHCDELAWPDESGQWKTPIESMVASETPARGNRLVG